MTFHPVTRSFDLADQAHELVAGLDGLADTGIVVTGSNADPEGRAVGDILKGFAERSPHAQFIANLGPALYANALRHCDAVAGNSSSGLYEAPSFGIPTVNIGARQAGRLRAELGDRLCAGAGDITRALAIALGRGRRETPNPYGDGRASERIVAVLKTVGEPRALLTKSFHDL